MRGPILINQEPRKLLQTDPLNEVKYQEDWNCFFVMQNHNRYFISNSLDPSNFLKKAVLCIGNLFKNLTT